jgi:hypothetical protein
MHYVGHYTSSVTLWCSYCIVLRVQCSQDKVLPVFCTSLIDWYL